jgi:DNA-directed RNA polymerase specialized sigma24 family protein
VPASLVGYLGDFDRAEDATQETFAIAAQRWPASGVPADPGAWLVTTARNRAIDRIRRDRTLAEKIHLLPMPDGPDPFGGQRAGFSATAQINRRDYGIDLTVPMDGGGVVVGDKVSISLEIQAVLQT